MKRKISIIAAVLMAALACYGQGQQTAPDYTNFVPQFQQDVVIYNPYADVTRHIDPKTPVNPEYALSETSALQLSVVLKDYGATLFHSGPFGWTLSWGLRGFAPGAVAALCGRHAGKCRAGCVVLESRLPA